MPSSACDWSSDVCSSDRSEEHTSELQSRSDLVCRLLLEKKKNTTHLTPSSETSHNELLAGRNGVKVHLCIRSQRLAHVPQCLVLYALAYGGLALYTLPGG